MSDLISRDSRIIAVSARLAPVAKATSIPKVCQRAPIIRLAGRMEMPMVRWYIP